VALRELVEKTTVANVVAGAIAIFATVAAIYYQQWELAAFIVGAAVSYLFPKQTG